MPAIHSSFPTAYFSASPTSNPIFTDLQAARIKDGGNTDDDVCFEDSTAQRELREEDVIDSKNTLNNDADVPTIVVTAVDTRELVAFETIAHKIAGSTVQTLRVFWGTCHAFFHQGEVLNNQQLAEAILYKTENQVEKQQFETMLSSPDQRAKFFNDASVQAEIAKAWCDGVVIDPLFFDGLQHGTPNLPSADQDKLVRHLLKVSDDLSSEHFVKRMASFFSGKPLEIEVTSDVQLGFLPNKEMMVLFPLLSALGSNMQQEIAQVIYEGRLGADSAVLQVVAQNLTMFTDLKAKQTIACAIRAGRLGTDLAVLQAVIQNLPMFTSREAQKEIVWAIREGRFGADPTMLHQLIKNLDCFTDAEVRRHLEEINEKISTLISPQTRLDRLKDSEWSKQAENQRKIAHAILRGKLGIDSTVLLGIAQNLATFTDREAQRTIAQAIRAGRFGTDLAVLRVVVQNLTVFADGEAQREIAQAIREGRLGTDSAVLQIIAQNLTMFTDSQAQLTIGLAIRHNRFGADPTVLQTVAQNLAIFVNPIAQQNIAWAICKGRFGTDSVMLHIIAKNITIFADSDAQRWIAKAILEGNFGTDPTVLQEVAQNLTVFTDSFAQQRIAQAILNGKFGIHLAVLQVIASKMDCLTDTQAQRSLAWAICRRRFRSDSAVLKEVAQNLTIFRDPEAQRYIVLAIYNGTFGTDSTVLQAVAQNLTIFSDPKAQRKIAEAIIDYQFGTDTGVLLVVAQNLGIFTDPEAQRNIALAIYNGRFGVDTEVLQAVAQKLTVFTDPRVVQRFIVLAIKEGQFGTDSAVLKTILEAVHQLLDTQTIIQLVSGSTLSAAEKKEVLIEVLRERKLSLDFPATAFEIAADALPNLFGAKAYLGSEIKTLLPPDFANATPDGIAFVCEDAVEYAIQIHHQQLILYPLTSHQDKADFIGWMHPENGVFYKQCVTNIKIFNFAELQGGYPTLTTGENLSPAHTIFATLPAYLQQAIRDNSFDINQFRYANVIRFVTETLMAPLVERDAGRANKMRAIMQASIVAQGNSIKIAQTNAEDAAIKDQINDLCDTKDIRTSSTTAVDTFLASLTPEAKQTVLPRLAVLLGTMAKKGVLGYHHGAINQANTLLYLLASHCFHKLQGSAGILFPLNFHQNLDQGFCIESLTNSFVIANRGTFSDVFATSPN